MVRDPDISTTTTGTTICTFTVATDRSWKTATGEKKEESEFHRVIAWDKLAEICGKMLAKGKKVYIDGRLSTRKYTNSEGVEKVSTEIVANDMMVFDSRPHEPGLDVSKMIATDTIKS